jgi:hypothetical protein
MHTSFVGFFDFDGTAYLRVVTRNGSWVPSAPGAAPTYKVYVNNGTDEILAGSFTGPDDSETGFYQLSLTLSAANGFAAGQVVFVPIEWTVSAVAFCEVQVFRVV